MHTFKITWCIWLFYSIYIFYFVFFLSFKNDFSFISYLFSTCFIYNLNRQQINNVSLTWIYVIKGMTTTEVWWWIFFMLWNSEIVKPKISKLSNTPTTYFTPYIFKLKSFLKPFTKWGSFNLRWFNCSPVTPVWTKMCWKCVCC